MRTRVAAARQWTGNGLEAFRRGRVGEARKYFNKASTQLPEDQDIIANVARTHFHEGQYQNAISELNRAIELDNADAALMVELGEYLLADGQVQAASEQARKALDENHRLPCAWLLSGRVHAASGNERAALGDFQKAVGIDPAREDIQLEVVRGYRRLGDPLRALSAVENILEKYPLHQQPTSALIEKSHALVQLNRTGTAVQTLNEAVTHGNDSQEVHLALANIDPRHTPHGFEKPQILSVRPQQKADTGFVDGRFALRKNETLKH